MKNTLKTTLFIALIFSQFTYAAPKYQKIISLGGTITEIIFALNEGAKIIGVDNTSVYPKEALKLTKLGYRQNISLEGIVSLKPDIVFASSLLAPKAIIDKLKTLGIEVIVVPELNNFDSAKKKVEIISTALNKKKDGQKIISIIDSDIQEIKELNKKNSKIKLAFIYARGGNRLFLAGKETGAHSMMKLSGAKNSFSTFDGYKPVSTEALIMGNPDAIIMLNRGISSLKNGPWKIKGLSQTTAGKKQNLIAVDDLAFLGFGPRSASELIRVIKLMKEIK
tara:strand:+ start:279 stop:1118 length:840 start_codon:yes stop_codon:yes gene_type:complete